MVDVLDLFANDKVWLTFSFLIFVWIVYSKGKGFIVSALDKKIDAIRTEFSEAENMRIEAQELLAQYQRKQNEANKEADQIIAHAKAHADEIVKSAEKDLLALVKRRERQLEDKLLHMRVSAENEIRQRATGLVLEATKHIIEQTISSDHEKKLLKSSLDQIPSQIH